MLNYTKITPEIVLALEKIVGEKYVSTKEEILDQYITDEETNPSHFVMPEAVVKPANAEEISAVVKLANEAHFPITVRSAGTSLSDGAIPVKGGVVLLMERLHKIIKLDEDAMYMEVEAGVTTKEIQELANSKKLFYAGDPSSADSCTIGGNIATNAGGSKAVRYGSTREQVYSIEAVMPTGTIVELGARLKKKSTGYCLEQLIMGSEGTLGIITKATLKLKPLQPYRFDLLAIFTDVKLATATVQKILKQGVDPTSVEFMDNGFVRSTNDFCHTQLPHYEDGSYIIVTIESMTEDDLNAKMEQLDDICTANGAVEVAEADERAWKLRRSCQESLRLVSPVNTTDDVVVPVDKVAACIDFVMEKSAHYPFKVLTLAHAGDGNLHFCACRGALAEQIWEVELEKFHNEVYKYAYEIGGRLSGEQGIGAKKIREMATFTNPQELAVMKTIKKALDPLNILNPGKLLDIS